MSKAVSKDKVEEALKTLADLLPAEQYAFTDNRRISGKDALNSGLELTEEQKEACIKDPKTEFIVPIVSTCLVNHHRRIRRAYKRNGAEGAFNYMKPYLKVDRQEDVKKWISLQGI